MTIKLPRLVPGYEDTPGLFPRYWDQAMTSIEQSVNAILGIPAINAAIDAANNAATNANNAAAAAQTSSNAEAALSSLVNSYIDAASYSGSLLTVTSAGVITVQNHTRVYGNPTLNPSKAVIGGTITTSGSAAGSIIRVYYSDPARAGGAVTYTYTIDPVAPISQTGNNHSVGVVTVPASGSSSGKSITPPGYVLP